jgi:imidazolonepropionase-like amidohydrolase
MDGYAVIRPGSNYLRLADQTGLVHRIQVWGTIRLTHTYNTTPSFVARAILRVEVHLMSRLIRNFWGLLLTLTLASALAEAFAAGAVEVMQQPIPKRWWFFLEQSRLDRKVHEFSRSQHPRAFAIEHAIVIPMSGEGELRDHSVIIQEGLITSVSPTSTAKVPPRAVRINARSRYLIPGFTDAHVHQAVSSSQSLLQLAGGITTVRDLDGFPWTLAMRERIKKGHLLAPSLYVSGTILNHEPMDRYARVVRSPEEGRRAVKDQKQAGYDFIKVHNLLLPETYEAIADEARKLGIDVVGHIPIGITVAQAVAAGQRTFEHFKGYILDQTLALSDEDYVSSTRGAAVWNCPTFYTYRSDLRGDPARALLRGSDMRFVSPRDKQNWLRKADEPLNPTVQNILPLSVKILRDLLPINARFLAGTDSGGGYAFMVPGLALHEELRLMEKAGLSRLQTLQSATIEPARAMRKEMEFGSIEVGKRADLVLLSRDPRQSLDALFESIEAVSIRGILLDRRALDQLLTAVEEVYSHTWPGPDMEPSAADVDEVVETYRSLRREGYVLKTHHLDEMSQLLHRAGKEQLAEEVRAMAIH